MDYGYRGGFGLWPRVGEQALAMAVLPDAVAAAACCSTGCRRFERQFGIDRIDVALIGHFHDDHVAGVPMLRRLFGTECWVPENFADLLAHPEAHRFPCDWPEPLADRPAPAARSDVHLGGIHLPLAPMSGHTRFSAAICSRPTASASPTPATSTSSDRADVAPDDWSWQGVMQNHVYRNGAFTRQLSRERRAAAQMAAGHRDLRPSARRCTRTSLLPPARLPGARSSPRLHRAAMVLGDDEAHFGLDGWGGWIWPYRIHVAEGETVRVTVTVRNPMPERRGSRSVSVGPGLGGRTVDLDARPAGRSLGYAVHPSRRPVPAAADRGGAPGRRPQFRAGSRSAGNGRRRRVLTTTATARPPPPEPAGRRGRS